MTEIKHETRLTSSLHTPGPWQRYADYEPLLIVGNVDGPDDGQMHYTRVCEVEDNAWADANVRLIAAAPKLLAALRAVKDAGYLDGAYQPTVDLVDAAIAEATTPSDGRAA